MKRERGDAGYWILDAGCRGGVRHPKLGREIFLTADHFGILRMTADQPRIGRSQEVVSRRHFRWEPRASRFWGIFFERFDLV